MASDPVDQHVIALRNFSQLDRLAEQMSSRTCNGRCICEFFTMVAMILAVVRVRIIVIVIVTTWYMTITIFMMMIRL